MRRRTLVLYLAAVSLFIAGASIAPSPQEREKPFGSEVCYEIQRKVPCERADGPWAHICLASVAVSCNSVAVAIEMSRHLPDHIMRFIFSTAQLQQSEATVSSIVHVFGAFLGLGLLLMGRALYMPLLFYLPAVLVGYASAQPLETYMESAVGLSEVYTCLLGSLVSVLFAHLQRTLFVRILGLLVGIVCFTMLLVTTSVFVDAPFQAVIALGVVAGLVGSVVVVHLEQTGPWKVVACALVGSVLLTDALGVGRFSSFVQGAACSMLVLTSCYRQLRSTRQEEKKRQDKKKRSEEDEDEEEWAGGARRKGAGRWSVGGVFGGREVAEERASRRATFGGMEARRRGGRGEAGAPAGVVEDELDAERREKEEEEEYDSEEEERRWLERRERRRKEREARREAEREREAKEEEEREAARREGQLWRKALRGGWCVLTLSAWTVKAVAVAAGRGVGWAMARAQPAAPAVAAETEKKEQ